MLRATSLTIVAAAMILAFGLPVNSEAPATCSNPALCGTIAAYDPDNPNQARIDFAQSAMSLIDSSTEAYYRNFRRMPVSLEDLAMSGWLWLDLVPSATPDGLQFVENRLTASQADLRKLEIIYSRTGYDFAVVVNSTNSASDSPFDLIRWEEQDFITKIDSYFAKWPSDSPFVDNDVSHIRSGLMFRLCDSFVSDYWRRHKDLPSNASELLDGRFTPIKSVFEAFPVAKEGEPGWFYFGIDPDKGIAFISRSFYGTYLATNQKLYKIDDPLASQGAIGRNISDSEGTTLDHTTPIVDSSIPGWGFLF